MMWPVCDIHRYTYTGVIGYKKKCATYKLGLRILLLRARIEPLAHS